MELDFVEIYVILLTQHYPLGPICVSVDQNFGANRWVTNICNFQDSPYFSDPLVFCDYANENMKEGESDIVAMLFCDFYDRTIKLCKFMIYGILVSLPL